MTWTCVVLVAVLQGNGGPDSPRTWEDWQRKERLGPYPTEQACAAAQRGANEMSDGTVLATPCEEKR